MAKRYVGLDPFVLFFYEEVDCESDKNKSEDFLKMCSSNMFDQSGSNLCTNDPSHTEEEADFVVDICELIVRDQGRYGDDENR